MDTAIFNQQYDVTSLEQKQPPKHTPPVYQISERAELVYLICYSKAELTEEVVYIRQLECI